VRVLEKRAGGFGGGVGFTEEIFTPAFELRSQLYG